MKMYINEVEKKSTYNASIAMAWYRKGNDIRVETFDDDTSRKIKTVIVHGEPQQHKLDENREHCKAIAKNLDKWANGEMFRCPECGEILDLSGQTVGDKYKCAACGEIVEYYDLEQLNLYDYFENDIYDIEYRVGSDREYRSARVMVACGGPNIYIDTKTKDVELYWWNESARYPIAYDTIDELDNFFEELFNC